MSNQKVFDSLIFSPEEGDADKIVAELKKRKDWFPFLFPTLEAAIAAAERRDFTVFIWYLNGKTLDSLQKLPELRLRQRELPIILVSETPQARIHQLTKDFLQVASLERSFTSIQLKNLCDKLEKGEILFQREHKRYPTEIAATLKRMEDETELSGTVLNVSRGGASMRVSRKILGLGELVELCVNLDQISKSHRVFAEVVWTTPKTKAEPDCEIGLKFMTPETLYYRYLKT